MPRLTQVPASSLDQFRLRACHAVSGGFPTTLTIDQIGNSTVAGPTTPEPPKWHGFGLDPSSLATTIGIEVSFFSWRY